jgi:hypothetical protein
MARTPQYERLLAELEAGEWSELEIKVLNVFLKAPNGITRRGLVRRIYGVEPLQNLNNDPYDRKIRKAIESLRDRNIPIVSSSGKAGYRLDTNPEAIRNMIAELRSRIAHMDQKIQVLQKHYDSQVEWQGENKE